MSLEIPPNGTRGARVPRGGLLRLGTGLVVWLYRVSGGRFIGGQTLLLTTTGARSGIRRTALLQWFEDGSGRWLVVGSAAGAARHPAWLYNLVHDPDAVWAEVGRDQYKVTPEVLGTAERPAAWQRIVAEAPQFGEYEHKTDRQMAVIRLTQEMP